MGTGINISPPFGSRYKISDEFAGQDKYWSQRTTYDDLLMAHGQHVRDYVDISHLAKGLMYSKLGMTESTSLTPLMEYVTGEGGTEVIDKNFVRWRIYGTPERRAMSFGNLNQNAYPGANGIPFIWFSDVDWYKDADVLAPVSNKRCQIRIVSEEAVPFDGGFKYDAVLIDSDAAAYIPAEYLAQGEYWIKLGTSTSWEKFGTPGSIQFGDAFSYIEFEVPLHTSAWEFTIDGEAHRQWGNLKIERCDEEYRPIPGEGKITNYHEMRAKAQIDYEKELWLTYGSSSQHMLDGNSGKQITTSPSLFEYLAEGNNIPYDPEVQGIDFLIEQIEALWFDRVPTANRELLLFTGEAGLKLFSRWVYEKFQGTSATFMYDFVLQKRTPFDSKSGRGGYAFGNPQFTEYLLDGFGSIKIAHWKTLDNTRINGVKYPGSFYPISSYEFIAFNIGFGESNVKFLSRLDNKISTYIPSLWSPLGATGADNPVWKTPGGGTMEDSYKWLHRESYGVILMDATQALHFFPNISL